MLRPLQPHGVGTAFVESLTSYVSRSAAELLVPVPRLLRAVAGVAGAFRYTQAVNGTELITTRIINAFAVWSGVSSLDRLGFAQPGLGLHLRKDFRRERAWCPRCLASPSTAYDQVGWSFAAVDRCPREGAKLQTTCAHCGHSHRVWDLWGHPLRCANCGADLADARGARGELDPRTAAVASVIAWIQSGGTVDPRRVAMWAREFRGQSPLGVTARRLGLTQWTLSNVTTGARRLQMDTLVSILTRCPTTMSELHTFGAVDVVTRPKPRRGKTHVDTRRLIRLVRAELALPVSARRTIVELARDLGVQPVTLRRHCPDTDRLISDRRDEVRLRRAA